MMEVYAAEIQAVEAIAQLMPVVATVKPTLPVLARARPLD
jgi:hypothetical protein